MRKTKDSIERKWAKKLETVRLRAEFKFNVLIENRKKKHNEALEHDIEKLEKKKAAYLNKKEKVYKRGMLNEIREFEWRPRRVYKSEWPKIKPIQFAMKIAQENARLRDTDEEGRWRCISCNSLCEWEELAGWHRYSRMFTNMCLEPENINAQCHTCNRITWPQWNPALKVKTNAEYDNNIEEKFWEWTVQRLKDLVVEFTKWGSKKYDLSKKIPELIRYNEELWWEKSTSFRENHKRRDWRITRNEYVKRHPEFEE